MWKLDNPVVLLLSLLISCLLLYTTSGGIIGLTLSFIIVACACVYQLVDDSLVTRHASFIEDCYYYFIQIAGISYDYLEIFISVILRFIFWALEIMKSGLREQVIARMERSRRNTYQLSSESLVSQQSNHKAPGELRDLQGVSPIPQRALSGALGSDSRTSIFETSDIEAYENARGFDKATSTPLISWKQRETANGDVGGDPGAKRNFGRFEERRSSLKAEETGYRGLEGSPWGTTISPKMRPRAAGVKTVQTVAGPLLASTRYNIDAKTYSDVTSPGLTSRLTKYATEANSRLIHHSQYGTGQFPKVNLNSSPTPLINSKTGKMRLPVTVRVAPPDSHYSPPDRHRVLSDICQKELPKTPPTVAEVLRDISLKRHASREDVASELIKKQRTDGLYSDDLETLEEMTQKRARDESSRSDEDISIDNTSSRPVKRTKKPSCYDIINSLSSSTSVNSGLKRKADKSRSGTPDIGKHFKNDNQVSPLSRSPELQKLHRSMSDSRSSMPEQSSRSPENSPKSPVIQRMSPDTRKIDEIFKDSKNSMPEVPVKLTDRLFMKEEPQNIEKLKTLIDEHSLTPKFSKGDAEEIKKSDIMTMRQTSMKAKLKSMFDAISGKTASTIDPSVVIQAEPINPNLVTLSSTTSTTNVNTSPISTSAVVPIIGKKTPGTPGKHVTFNLPVKVSEDSAVQAKEIIKKTETATAPTFSFGSNAEKSQSLGFPLNSAISTSAPVIFSSSITATAVTSQNSTSAVTLSTTAVSKPQMPVPATPNPVLNFVTSSSPLTSQGTTTNLQSPPQLSFPAVSNVPTSLISSSFNTSSKTGTFSTPTSGTPPSLAPVTASLDIAKTSIANKPASPTKVPGFSFGGTPASTSSLTNPVSTASTTTGFSFGGSAPAFGVTPTTTAVAQSGFSFGGKTSTSQSGFSFGGNSVPVPSFGGTISQVSSTTTTLTFGASTTAPAFGTSTSTAPAFVSTSTAPTFGTTSITAPAFGTSSTTVPAFGASVTTTPNFATPATTTPMFGTPVTTAPAFGTAITTASAFETAVTTAPAFGTTVTPAPAFGTAVTTAPNFPSSSVKTPGFGISRQSTLNFAAPSTTTPAFGTATTTAPGFGTPAMSAPAFGTAATSAPVFGISTAPAFGTPSNSTPSFGTSSTTTPVFATSSTTTPNFGTTSTTVSPFGSLSSTTSAPTFATPSTGASLSFGTPASSTSLFNTQANMTFGSGSTPIFGASTQPSTTSAISFGAQKPTLAFGATSSSTFNGSAVTSAPAATPMFSGTSAFGKPTSSLGSSTSFSSPSLFGAPTTTTAGFGVTSGTSISTSTSGFGQTTSTFPSSTPSFGGTSSVFGTQNGSSSFSGTPTFGATTTAPPAFPTATQSTPVFGTSTTSSFGTQSTAAPVFGNSSSFSGFASSASTATPFGGSTPAFGSSSSTAAPAFGTSSSSGATFTFGGSSTTSAPTQGTQPNSMFSFGGSSSSTSGSGFQFNGSTAPPSGGFNFSGSATPGPAIPSFSAPAPGPAFGSSSTGNMFSIGSGSVIPRSRSNRQGRRQR